ncbi:ATP-NAD kinase family protein [Saccharopolyspora thermophila]|uniref:NAD(+)/NADH kinase n=1 Tax=Saccharopolyspora thermophila TaxID=89367 RepID=A0ABN1D921_9PSEU
MAQFSGNGRPPRADGSAIGVIANPMSGRDIRRLVAHASVFPNAEKANMVLRIVAAAGALGVDRVLLSTDEFGVAAGVLRAIRQHAAAGSGPLPELVFCELDPVTGTAEDTRALVRRMRADGAALIVVLGGDGTVRAAAGELGDTPLLPLSTGTNNAFPQMWEATVAGAAAALVAVGRVDARDATRRAKVLRVDCGPISEIALVDVCVSVTDHVGARALWRADSLRELYCTFAEPHAIGLSSIAGQLLPTARDEPHGVAVRFAAGEPTRHSVLAPLAPGKLTAVEVAAFETLPPGQPHTSDVSAGTVALDGEREFEFRDPVTVTLSDRGPRVLDVRAVLATAARDGLLRGSPTVPESATGVTSWRVAPHNGGKP